MRVRYYQPHLKTKARQLRINQTEAEKLLWTKIRGRRLLDLKFQRQFELGNYIVDFVCRDLKIVIELDGGQHNMNQVYDQKRTIYLESLGYKLIRYWDSDVMKNIDGVLEDISSHVSSHPNPLSRREGAKRKILRRNERKINL